VALSHDDMPLLASLKAYAADGHGLSKDKSSKLEHGTRMSGLHRANDTEAIRLVNDWSKWMVTIEIALISAIGFFATRAKEFSLDTMAKICIVVSLGSFLVSIAAAACLLIALPGVVQRLPPPDNQDVGDMKSPRTLLRLSIRSWGAIQHAFFLIGIVGFTALIMRIVLSRNIE
jgi:hypothetical protein